MTARVYSLMCHYWRDDVSTETRAMVIADWFAVLADIPEAAIERAIIERLSEDDGRKPKPGEIRKRAREFVARPVPPLKLAPPTVVVSKAELARRREMQPGYRRIFPGLKQMKDA